MNKNCKSFEKTKTIKGKAGLDLKRLKPIVSF